MVEASFSYPFWAWQLSDNSTAFENALTPAGWTIHVFPELTPLGVPKNDVPQFDLIDPTKLYRV